MGFIRNLFIQNTSGNTINPATEESLAILRQILKNTESLQMVDPYGRLRINLMDFYANTNNPSYLIDNGVSNGNLQMGNFGVVLLVNVTYLGYIGSNSQLVKYTLWDIMNNVYGSGNSTNLTRS